MEDDEYFEDDLITLFENFQIRESCDELKSFLHLLSNIFENHQQKSNYMQIFEKSLLYFKADIQKYYLNSEIFTIFKHNKRLLLFLLQSKILSIDNFVLSQLKTDEYSTFFFPEIKYFLTKKELKKIIQKIPTEYEYKRQQGQNDSYLSYLIRNDLIDDFIVYVNQVNISLSKKIPESIFETNSLLSKNKHISLIEYATYFGSINIFKYLRINNVQLESGLWIYAIHSNNAEIIHLLEESLGKQNDEFYKKILEESIKCHHNEIADYLIANYFDDIENQSFQKEATLKSLKYYNFSFINKDFVNKSTFIDLCRFDYASIVEKLLKYDEIDINEKKLISVKKLQYDKVNGYYDNGESYDKIHDETTALNAATENNNIEIVKYLLAKKNLNLNEPCKTHNRKIFYLSGCETYTDVFRNKAPLFATIAFLILEIFVLQKMINLFFTVIPYVVLILQYCMKISNILKYFIIVIAVVFTSYHLFLVSFIFFGSKNKTALSIAKENNNEDLIKIFLKESTNRFIKFFIINKHL